ncbi:MAG: PAS domain-containing protein [Bacteroidota bacterium]
MVRKISILYVEDVAADAELTLLEISRNGISFSHTIVETKKDYIDKLISIVPDLILSDYALPQFDGMNALSLRNEIAPQTPFLLVTGSVNEEVAVECMKAGADDYILKRNISRLFPAIEAAFAKRDRILIHMKTESASHIKKEKFKIEDNSTFLRNTDDFRSKGSGLEEYMLIEEKLTFLDMALESAGIGTWVFDLAGNKRYFDKEALRLFGFSKGQYKRSEKEFLNLIHPDDRLEVNILLSDAQRILTDFETDFRVILPDGVVRFLTARAKTIINDRGVPVRLNGLVWDITDHKLLQMTLQENMRKTNSIINNLNGAVFRCKCDDEMTMEFISEGVKSLTGYPSWDFLMNRVRSFASLIYVDDRERVIKNIENSLNEQNPFTIEYRIVSANDEIKWIWERGRGVFACEKAIAIEGFFTDISDKKKFEEELKSSLEQQHQLTQYIEKVRESERIAISRELHDDLGQALTAVKIDLGSIRQIVTSNELVVKISKVSDLVSETIKTVQKLTSQLRPQIIDDLGLESAIEWYAKEFEQRSKIKIILDLDPGLSITPDASLIIFRVMQETLTNVARHSGATQVNIKLTIFGDDINLRISDNGIGISEDEISSKKSFGIISMRERAASLRGTFKIYRGKKGGTVIELVFPLSNSGSYENSDL